MGIRSFRTRLESLLGFGLALMLVPVLFLVFLHFSEIREQMMAKHVIEYATEVDRSLQDLSDGLDRQAFIISETLPLINDAGSASRFIDTLLEEFVDSWDEVYTYFYTNITEGYQNGWFVVEGFDINNDYMERSAMAYGKSIELETGVTWYVGIVCGLSLDSHGGTNMLHIQTDNGILLDRSFNINYALSDQIARYPGTDSDYKVAKVDSESYLVSHQRLVNGFLLVETQWLTPLYQKSFYVAGLLAAIALVLYVLQYPFLKGEVSPLEKLRSCNIKKGKYTLFVVGFILFVPFVVQLVAMWSMPNIYIILLIVPAGLVLSLFLLSEQMHRRFLLGFLMAIQVVIFMEYIFVEQFRLTPPVLMAGGVMLLGYILFCIVGIYMKYAVRSYKQLEDTSQQFNQTQAAYLENEKMATLGRLISGIAHEINTPMGAIKACAENMDAKLKPVVRGLLVIGKNGEILEEDINELFTLIDLCSQSVREMRSTSEVRKAKKQISEFAMQIGLDEEVTRILVKLEICDIEKLEKNMDTFKNPRIVSIMHSIEYIYSYVSNLQNIAYATDRITRIVLALKSYVHTGDKNQFIPFDIIRNIENVLVLYHNQTKHGIEIVRQFGEDLPYVIGNQDELSQVWTNLLQNAIYAMSGVGKLTISVHQAQRDNDVDKMEIKITDTGTGIAQDDLERIFEAFFTTKPYGEGSGMGLDICKKIIEQHAGTIGVNSKQGVGTTFTVTLPSASAPTSEKRDLP